MSALVASGHSQDLGHELVASFEFSPGAHSSSSLSETLPRLCCEYVARLDVRKICSRCHPERFSCLLAVEVSLGHAFPPAANRVEKQGNQQVNAKNYSSKNAEAVAKKSQINLGERNGCKANRLNYHKGGWIHVLAQKPLRHSLAISTVAQVTIPKISSALPQEDPTGNAFGCKGSTCPARCTAKSVPAYPSNEEPSRREIPASATEGSVKFTPSG